MVEFTFRKARRIAVYQLRNGEMGFVAGVRNSRNARTLAVYSQAISSQTVRSLIVDVASAFNVDPDSYPSTELQNAFDRIAFHDLYAGLRGYNYFLKLSGSRLDLVQAGALWHDGTQAYHHRKEYTYKDFIQDPAIYHELYSNTLISSLKPRLLALINHYSDRMPDCYAVWLEAEVHSSSDQDIEDAIQAVDIDVSYQYVEPPRMSPPSTGELGRQRRLRRWLDRRRVVNETRSITVQPRTESYPYTLEHLRDHLQSIDTGSVTHVGDLAADICRGMTRYLLDHFNAGSISPGTSRLLHEAAGYLSGTLLERLARRAENVYSLDIDGEYVGKEVIANLPAAGLLPLLNIYSINNTYNQVRALFSLDVNNFELEPDTTHLRLSSSHPAHDIYTL